MTKRKTKKQDFAFLTLPARLLAMPRISMVEKVILAEVGHFNGNGYPGYTESNAVIAKKFGVSRRAVINAIQRLRAVNYIKDIGPDVYHRQLKLNGEVSSLFEDVKGEEIALPEKAKKFQKPSAQEVTDYAQSIGFQLDGEHFVSHYEAKGWKIGKTPMKNWKAAVVMWKKRDNNGSSKSSGNNQSDEPYIR